MCIMCIREIAGAKYLPSPDEPADPSAFIKVPATPHSKSRAIRDIHPTTCVETPIMALSLQELQGLPVRS